MHATKTVKGAYGSSLLFQNSEHPRIGYFGHKKLNFDRLNVFFETNKKLDYEKLMTFDEKTKQRQTNVEETGLWETIIRVEAQSKALRHTHPVRSRPIILVQAQG